MEGLNVLANNERDKGRSEKQERRGGKARERGPEGQRPRGFSRSQEVSLRSGLIEVELG